MIFGLHPLFGFLPLLLYIVLMMMGKDMNVSVLLCVILGAILTGESITGFADTLYASLGSFCALIGFIIVLGSGLAEVLSQTKVAHNLVYMVVNRFKLKSKKMAILISMITSTLLVSLLGTLAGSNAIIAPILMSGVIELAQEYCTEARSGEWADFAANSTGVVLAALLGHFVLRRHIHPKNKDNDSKEQGGRARD